MPRTGSGRNFTSLTPIATTPRIVGRLSMPCSIGGRKRTKKTPTIPSKLPPPSPPPRISSVWTSSSASASLAAPSAWAQNGPQPPRSFVRSVYQGEMELVLGPACPDQGAASPSGSFESGESDGPEVCLCGWLREDHGRPGGSYGDARGTTPHAWARGMIVGARGAMLDVLRWIEGTETQEAVGPLEQIRGRIQGHLDDMAAAGVLDPDGDKK